MNRLKQIHAYTLRTGVDQNKLLLGKLLEIPDLPYAQKLFDHIPQPTVFLYNKIIQAYSSRGRHNQCLSLYSQMCLQGYSPNEYTFTFLFSACASLSSPLYGQMIHCHFLKSGFVFDLFALTALVDMYAKLGLLVSARRQFDEMGVRDIPTWNSLIAGYAKRGDLGKAKELFDRMSLKNVVSWTSMISGYSQNGRYVEALSMFLRMEKDKEVTPNEVTLASVLPACANLGALEVGERIEAYARENGFLNNLFVRNALLEMYGRCGRIDRAKQVFEEIGKRRNLCTWNSMIMSLAVHGKSKEALDHFYQMLREGYKPDDVTFVAILLACTHCCMVVEGRKLFKSMKSYSITPKIEHYGCMVDLLGRAGELFEAYNLIKSMPMKPDSVIWGALLGACSFHRHVELAEKAAEALFELEPLNPGNYVILSNIYAAVGQWDGVAMLRKLMKSCHITKAAGSSLIEEGDQIQQFIVEDKSHSRSNEIYALLDDILLKMKSHVHVTDLDCEFEN